MCRQVVSMVVVWLPMLSPLKVRVRRAPMAVLSTRTCAVIVWPASFRVTRVRVRPLWLSSLGLASCLARMVRVLVASIGPLRVRLAIVCISLAWWVLPRRQLLVLVLRVAWTLCLAPQAARMRTWG